MRTNQGLLRQWQLLARVASAKDGCTVRELVEATGVCEKTIRRDLISLKEAGFPLSEIVSRHGRKHWQLESTAAIPQLRFTLEEVAALHLGRSFSNRSPALISTVARRARSKKFGPRWGIPRFVT